MKADKRNKLSDRLMAAILNDSLAMKVPWWRSRWKASNAGKIVNRSKYSPHQGARERSRHRTQITKGFIR